MNFAGKPSPDELERYRSYLKLIAQMQLNMRLRVKEDASDVAQRVLLSACQDLDTFRGTSEVALKAWLTKIASNVLAELGRHYSRQRREVAREVPLAIKLEHSSALLHRSLIGKERAPCEGLIVQEEIDHLIEALLKLLEDERTAIVLKHLHNWPIAEIAEHLGRTEPAVAGLLRRGLAKLRSLLCNCD
jgi:RNA polymerase sigma-70 factor (ECF subfamily)